MGSILSAYILPHPPIMIPEIGGGREVEISSTINACKKVSKEISQLQPDTIVIISPHGLSLADQICISTMEDLKGDFRNFDRKDIKLEFQNDLELTELIIQKSREKHFPLEEIDEDSVIRYDITSVVDHGSLVPLYYVNQNYNDYKLVHISMGFLDYEYLNEFGGIIREAIEASDLRCVIIASGDLSHKLEEEGPYGYNQYGKVFDTQIVNILKTSKLSEFMNIAEDIIEEAAQCGLRSFITLAGCFAQNKIQTEILSYEGPFGVGYCVAKISESYG
jgi:aromatic ring-opening dioxygenase LigB subunit